MPKQIPGIVVHAEMFVLQDSPAMAEHAQIALRVARDKNAILLGHAVLQDNINAKINVLDMVRATSAVVQARYTAEESAVVQIRAV
jgi:hypothetical protein